MLSIYIYINNMAAGGELSFDSVSTQLDGLNEKIKTKLQNNTDYIDVLKSESNKYKTQSIELNQRIQTANEQHKKTNDELNNAKEALQMNREDSKIPELQRQIEELVQVNVDKTTIIDNLVNEQEQVNEKMNKTTQKLQEYTAKINEASILIDKFHPNNSTRGGRKHHKSRKSSKGRGKGRGKKITRKYKKQYGGFGAEYRERNKEFLKKRLTSLRSSSSRSSSRSSSTKKKLRKGKKNKRE